MAADATGDQPGGGTPPDGPDSKPKTKRKSKPARRTLTRNVNIDGAWYGPAYGNAADYPDWPGKRDRLFEE